MAITLKSLGFFLTRCAIAALVIMFLIFVRLAYGPTPVDRLGQTIAEPFQKAFPDRQLTYEGSYLEWDWRQFAFIFSLEDIKINNADGTPFADFPRLGVGYTWGSLFTGSFVPNRVNIDRPEMHFDWDALEFGADLEKALFDPEEELPIPEEDEKPPALRIMEAMLKGEGEDSPLKNLKTVNIRDARIILTEQNTGVVWTIPRSDLVATRAKRGLGLEADLEFISENEIIEIAIQSRETDDGLTETVVSMEGLNVAKLAREVNLGPLFQTIDMPLYGTLTLRQNAVGGINLLGFDLGGGPGTIFYRRLNSLPAHFEDVVFKGSLDPAANLISLEALRLALNGDVITGDGFIEFTPEDREPALRMVLQAQTLNVDTFLQLWPTAKRSGGRDWIAENVENGKLSNVRAELSFTPETWGQKPLPNEAMHITLDFDDGEVYYQRPMPPLTNIRGHLMIEGNEAQGIVYEGVVDGKPVQNIDFRIENLTKSKAQMGHARFPIADDLQYLMRFVDQEPLNIFIKQGLDPADYFGNADLQVSLQVPLYTGAPPEATSYTIEGRVTEAAVPSLMAGGGLTEGDLTMTVTPFGLVSQGKALLKGVPFDFYWTQDFVPESATEFTTRIELNGLLTDQHLHVFGLPEDLSMEGRARVYVSLQGLDGELKFGQGRADFFKPRVTAPKMDWFKPPNRRAEVAFDLEWVETELRVNNVNLKSPEFTLQAAFIFDDQTGLMKRADIPVYLTANNDLTATARQRPDGVLDVSAHAKSFNAYSYLEDMFEDSPEESFAPDMRLVLVAETVYGMNEVVYTNLSLEAYKRREFWVTANIIGGIDEGGAFQVALTHDDTGRHLTIESDNAGRFALGADVFRNATGGRMNLTADMNVFEAPLFAEGELTAHGFKLVKSSVLIQALSEEEKSGLDEMIREEGMMMSRMSIPFRLENRIFDISDATARGEQFGFTMEGEIDEDFYRMNLNGTIIPAYSLNTFISRIPIIGTIIAGGPGEGLFALNYRITGTREDPDIDFKEMSAVAPGIFRKILGSQEKGRLEPEPEVEAETPPEEPETTVEAQPEPETDDDEGGGLLQF